MRGYIYAILILIFGFLTHSGYSQSYGLRFSSHEVVQEKRTSLNVSPSERLCFDEGMELSFDILFTQDMEIYFGYVFRLITADSQNIDLIYNQRLRNFNLITGERVADSFRIDSVKLYTEWSRVAVRINAREHEILLFVDNKLVGKAQTTIKGDLCFKLSFGTNNFDEFQTADIPPMSIKDIRLSEGSKVRYYWPLSETGGDEARDSIHKAVAHISNPSWIRPRHQNWQLVSHCQVGGTPSIAFDAKGGNLFIVGGDSMYSYSLEKAQLTGARWADGRTALLPAGNQSIYSPVTRHLYNLYIDQQKVRTYDQNSGKWDNNFSPGPLTEFWHANKFLSYADSSLYMIDGYGQLKYKNGVQRYRFADKKWEVVQTGGDYFTPRYLAALGANSRGDTAYIMGGYGSATGDQMVNPRYWYDLLEYSVKDRAFKTLYHFKEPEEPFCFANSLIIDSATGQYYALIYPNDKFNSRLQLISGSLRAPGYRLLGDAIPYSFHDIKSFADLYYCPASKQLVAVTLYTSKDNRTEVKIYTIAFPPNALMPVVVAERKSFPWIYLLGIIPLVALGWWVVSRYRRRGGLRERTGAVLQGGPGQQAAPVVETVASASLPDLPVPSDPPAPIPVAVEDTAGALSKIYFFGQFEVYDKAGQDLSRQFTPLLKELFLLIVIYSLRSGKGISSEKLYATLWRDKSNKDAQNNRSVNMVKLKVILDKLGTCGIVKEADKWVFHYAADQIRIDLAAFLVLIGHPQPDKELIRRLLGIVHKGAFLSDTAYPWLDDIKSEISDKALDALSAASLRFSADKEFLLEIASGIFLFDPVNEEALKVKCKSLGALGRHSLAKAAFEKFAKEYQLMYGEEFQQTFHEILAD